MQQKDFMRQFPIPYSPFTIHRDCFVALATLRVFGSLQNCSVPSFSILDGVSNPISLSASGV